MNDQNKRQIIIAGVLGALLLGVLVYQFVINAGPPELEVGASDGATAAAEQVNSAAHRADTAPAKMKRDEIDIDLLLQDILKH